MSEPTFYQADTSGIAFTNEGLRIESMLADLKSMGVLKTVQRCKHTDNLFPFGHLDGHWVNDRRGRAHESAWCPGAGIGGDE